MEPCVQDVSRAMAVSEMGLSPNTCQRPGHGGQVEDGKKSSKENMVDETNMEKVSETHDERNAELWRRPEYDG
ncbi:hypothetical protein PoB_000816300 [Plakobranchus ocellatus]|uniref:Uncharacterized protein n=1 Tax=Plakobranchus ocellatus TaxID=259542 RepID=A0AAV3YGY6_9GAST|nr:hypothetical protein PoB_000816300 [Plakobranchus ocellatus]